MVFDHFDDIHHHFSEQDYHEKQIGALLLNQNEEQFEEAAVAFIGIQDSRHIKECTFIREELYRLYQTNRAVPMYDLGNFSLLDKEQFSFQQLSGILEELLERSIVPVLFGGSQKTMYSVQKAFARSKQYMNAGMINSRFEFVVADRDLISDTNYLMKLCQDPESFLFNFMQIGYQTYLVSPESRQLMNELHFDEMRLGLIRDDMKEAEPLLRDLDVLGISMEALKFAESGGQSSIGPNGLYSEELAQLVRYAGMSDKLQCVGFFDYSIPNSQSERTGARLFAQSIWCFLEAFSERKREWPDRNDKQFLRYTIHNSEMDLELVFLKSEVSGRWWIQMPEDKAALQRTFYIPCSYNDYQIALEGDIPDRWLRGFNKLG